MNKLPNARRAAVVAALVEGNSIRATVRLTGVAKNTVTKLLVDLGAACSAYQDVTFRNLPCQRIQCDEIWSFCHNNEKNTAPEHNGVFGYENVWTWTAIDTDTKLVPSWLVGKRDTETAQVKHNCSTNCSTRPKTNASHEYERGVFLTTTGG